MNQDKTQVVVEFLRDIRTDEKLFSQLVHRESFAKLVSAHVVDFREDVKRRDQYEMEATPLRDGQWAVRPKGQLGTCGWHPYPWTVVYVKARNAQDAINKARR